MSYVPEFTRTVRQWLTYAGVAWALACDCCNSLLMSTGLYLSADSERSIGNRHYLELLFGRIIDWLQVFVQLGGMRKANMRSLAYPNALCLGKAMLRVLRALFSGSLRHKTSQQKADDDAEGGEES